MLFIVYRNPEGTSTQTLASPNSHLNAAVLSFTSLLLVCLWIYLPVKGFDYLAIDDAMHTEANARISPLTLPNVGSFWTTPYENAYTPVTYTLWTLLAHLGKNTEAEKELSKTRMNPEGNKFKPGYFHVGNLVVHILTTFAVFLLLKILFHTALPSFLGSLLFAVHPLQVESVCWITGLRDVLAGLFSILSLYCYLKYVSSSLTLLKHRTFYGLAFLSFFVGVLCKSSALMTPFIGAILAYFYFRRAPLRIVLDFIPWIALITPIMRIFFGLNDSVALKVVYQAPFPLRLYISGDAITFYLAKLFFPLELTMDYGRTPQYVLQRPEHYFTGLFPVFLGILSLFFYFRNKSKVLLVCFGIFILGLGPVLGITPFIFQHISTTADRYVYLSLLGPCVALATFFHSSFPVKFKAMAVLVLFAFVLKSTSQVEIWRNNLTLFAQTLEHNPQSWLGSNDLGTVFEGMGQSDTAMSLYERSGEISNIPSAWNNAGAMAIELKDYARAYEFFELAIKSSAGSSWAHHNLGAAYMMSGQRQKAMEEYKIASSRDDRHKNAHKNPKILRKDDGRKPHG